jgi:hypothetical protein
MSFSSLLQVLLIAENQNDKYQTHNDGISALEQAANQVYKNTADTSTIAVVKADFQRNTLFKFSGPTADRIVTFPSTTDTGSSINSQRRFTVWNASSFNLTLKASSGTGTSYVLQPGHFCEAYLDHEDFIALNDFNAGSPLGAYDVAFFIPDKPNDNVNGLIFTAVRAFKLPSGLSGSQGSVGTVPTSAATLTIKKNASTIGTINVAITGAVTFTFSSDVSFAAGDKLVVVTPTPQDATLADVAVTFLATRI